MKRYHEINNKKPVFLCLALHGKPKDPEFIFIIPMKKLNPLSNSLGTEPGLIKRLNEFIEIIKMDSLKKFSMVG